MRLGEPGQLLVARLIDDLLVFLIPDIADALEEQQREDVGLEVRRIHWAAQDVGGLPEVDSSCSTVTVCFCAIFAIVVLVRQPLSHYGAHWMSFFRVGILTKTRAHAIAKSADRQ